MTLSGKVLLVPERRDSERDAVAEHWRSAGGRVVRLGRFWDPPPLPETGLRPYGNDTFCLVLAQKLDLRELSPPDDLLIHLDAAVLGRRVALTTLDALDELPAGFAWPVFAKSAAPKLFTAGVYANASVVREVARDLPSDTGVLLSTVVDIDAEVRSFVLDGRVLSAAAYEGELAPGELEAAVALTEAIAAHPRVPRSCVLDLGRVREGPERSARWVMVEANAAWGAGLNGCAPEAAARCIEAAWLD